jgi:hypothetical protein
MPDIIVIGVIVGTILLWGGAALFFFGVRSDKNKKVKKVKKKG